MAESEDKLTSAENEELLSRARDGDASSLWRLTENYRPYLQAVISNHLSGQQRQRVGDSDIVQETLTAAVGAFDGFRGATLDEWRVWLGTIARNAARGVRRFETRARRDVRRDVTLHDDSRVAPHAAQPTIADLLEDADSVAELIRAIQLLSENDQQIIQLRNFEDLTYTDIATRLSISESAARKRWSIALRNLRQQLSSK